MAGPPPNFASLLRARRGYLATAGTDGVPHLVPVCFTWAGDVIWTAIDGKRKSGDHLQRLEDISSNPTVSFIVDRWDEDWSRLAWLQARGGATLLKDPQDIEKAQGALRDKYAQYKETALDGPVIRIDVEKWVAWSAES